jgi:hypothetical protein
MKRHAKRSSSASWAGRGWSPAGRCDRQVRGQRPRERSATKRTSGTRPALDPTDLRVRRPSHPDCVGDPSRWHHGALATPRPTGRWRARDSRASTMFRRSRHGSSAMATAVVAPCVPRADHPTAAWTAPLSAAWSAGEHEPRSPSNVGVVHVDRQRSDQPDSGTALSRPRRRLARQRTTARGDR